nr:hypothetical protein BaRGS_017765 [Batillaria attramentaria]
MNPKTRQTEVTQFILTLVMVGYGRALSIFFMEFIAMFEASVTTATIGFGIMAACFGVGSMCVPSEVIVQDTTTSQKLDPGTAQPEAGQPVDDECGNSCVRAVSSVVDLSMFKNWLFILIVVYAPLGLNAGFIAFYFPSLGVDKGLSRASAALLLTVVGGVDMVSRLVVGYVADLNIVKRTHLVAINLLILGMASQFTSLRRFEPSIGYAYVNTGIIINFSFYSSFPLLAMYAVIYGLCAGTCQNLLVVVIIDLLGLERLGKAMGLVLVVNATCAALTHPIIGMCVTQYFY